MRGAPVLRFPLEIAPMPGAAKAIPCADKAAREEGRPFFALAKAGKQVDDENPHYPADVQAALDRFTATPAGGKFVLIWQAEAPEAKESVAAFSGDITQRCLVSAAKK